MAKSPRRLQEQAPRFADAENARQHCYRLIAVLAALSKEHKFVVKAGLQMGSVAGEVTAMVPLDLSRLWVLNNKEEA